MIDSFHSSGNFSFFQIEVISLWISKQIVPPPASNSSSSNSNSNNNNNNNNNMFLHDTELGVSVIMLA